MHGCNHEDYRKLVFETFLQRPLSEVYVQLSPFVSHLIFLLRSNMISYSTHKNCTLSSIAYSGLHKIHTAVPIVNHRRGNVAIRDFSVFKINFLFSRSCDFAE